MILILGRNDDHSTTEVVEWLRYYNKDYIVFNTEDNFKIIKYSQDDKCFIIRNDKEEEINLFDVTSVWNRRHGLSHKVLTNQYISRESSFFLEQDDKSHYSHILDESKSLLDFIHHISEKHAIVKIGSFLYNDVNKLVVLDKANQLGLSTPKSFIFTCRDDLINLKKQYPKQHIITKPFTQGVYRPDIRKKYMYYNYVERLTSERINNLSETFYPSFFQLEEKKQYELRIFFLIDEFYPMAIFSQTKKDAVTDFRRTNHRDKPLVSIPYKLPKDIEIKLLSLMNELHLNTGSIDMIVNEKREYVFLEVNPCGQFGMTSYPCNYYLEKIIAQKLQ